MATIAASTHRVHDGPTNEDEPGFGLGPTSLRPGTKLTCINGMPYNTENWVNRAASLRTMGMNEIDVIAFEVVHPLVRLPLCPLYAAST